VQICELSLGQISGSTSNLNGKGSAAVKSESRKLGEIEKYPQERNRAPIAFEKLISHSPPSMKTI